MTKILAGSPRLVQRKCGGWMALSSRDDRLRIGVTAATAEEASSRYVAALMEWGATLNQDQRAAVSET